MPRSILERRSLLIASACLTLIPLAASQIMGSGYISVNNFKQQPVFFFVALIFPAFLMLLTIVLAIVPRVLQVNLLVFVALLITVDLIFQIIATVSPHPQGDPQSISERPYYQPDPILGYRAAPNVVARHVQTYGKRKLYDVFYKIDSMGRRITPLDDKQPRSKFLLFFGCSNTFGDGLKERQTIPYY